MKKISVMLPLVLLLGIVVFTLCSLEKNEAKSVAAEGDNGRQEVEYLMAGKVEANEQVDITSRIAAKIIAIHGDVGSSVNKGDTLVQLDSKDLEAQVAQANAAVLTAQANLNRTVNGARPEQIVQAQATFAKAKNDCERMKALFDMGAVSKQQLEDAQLTFTNAREQLNILTSGSPDDVKVANSQLTQAQAALQAAVVQLENGAIVSPISGIISAKNVHNGEMAAAGVPLLTVVNPGTLLVNAYLPVSLMGKLQNGQGVVIKIAELPDQDYVGEVSAIDTAIDPKYNSALVKVSIKNQDGLLKPGMIAKIGVKK